MGNKKKPRSAPPPPPPPTADELLASAPTQFLTKQGKSSLKTLVSSHPQIFSSLLSSLLSSISKTLASFKSQSQSRPQSPSSSPPSKRCRPSETLEPLKTLECYAFIAHLLLSHPNIQSFAPDLLLCIQSLHDSLVLFESSSTLLSAIANLCELYWKDKFLGREKLISQSLPYFLSKSLSNGKKSDVHRVYAMREGFALFDYEDESIEDVRMLLVRCVIAPLYLKTEEGRKFLAFVMGLNLRLGKEVLAMVRSQIPFGRKSVLEAYGEILFRAWKGAGEEWLREEIEDGFVQGLIDAAVHAREKGLAGSIRRVLGGFIEQRATNGVEKLLFRLSEPVLFRSLQVIITIFYILFADTQTHLKVKAIMVKNDIEK